MTASSNPALPPARSARVVLCDDHPALPALVVSALTPECTVVGMVGDARALLKEMDRLAPDLVVLDISMPGMSGLEAACEIRRSHPRTRIVFLTVHEDPDFAQAAFAAGGLGFVVKSRLATDLLPAVRAALGGRRFLSTSVRLGEALSRILGEPDGPKSAPKNKGQAPP
jgi:DNA-binding NarL/FixJ family response regulator